LAIWRANLLPQDVVVTVEIWRLAAVGSPWSGRRQRRRPVGCVGVRLQVDDVVIVRKEMTTIPVDIASSWRVRRVAAANRTVTA
jgi:hypothetical protein